MHLTDDRQRRIDMLVIQWALCGAALLTTTPLARAGLIDSLFGTGSTRAEVTPAGSKQRFWRVREFSAIELVKREAGAGENQHPVSVSLEPLRQQLALIGFGPRDSRQLLFTVDEAAELALPLSQALMRAGPADDVLLLSSSRREGGILAAPTSVTARLFVQGGQLQMIVHDARFDFYDNYRGTQALPRFTYGSRDAGSEVLLQSTGATNRRADWLAIPLGAPAAQKAEPLMAVPAAPAALVPGAPAAVAVPAAVAAPAAPAAAVVETPRKPLDAGGAQDIERRLETLKRLRERGLITEEEFQQKRKEVLQLL